VAVTSWPPRIATCDGRFLDVLADIRSRYVLSYSNEGVPEPGWHTLTVRLKRKKGDLLARKGYWR
jgi:hypothetical protein